MPRGGPCPSKTSLLNPVAPGVAFILMGGRDFSAKEAPQFFGGTLDYARYYSALRNDYADQNYPSRLMNFINHGMPGELFIRPKINTYSKIRTIALAETRRGKENHRWHDHSDRSSEILVEGIRLFSVRERTRVNVC